MYATYSVTINSNPYLFIDVKFDHEPRDTGKMPQFSLTLPNRFGQMTLNPDFNPGSVVNIFRQGELVFVGVVEPRTFRLSKDASTVTLAGSNRWYKKLSNTICDSYDFKESLTDYGVTINPYEFKVFRHLHPSATIDDVTLERPALFGFTKDNVARHVIGTKFLYGIEFLDNSHLLKSSISSNTSYLQCYRDSQVGRSAYDPNYYETTPRLQTTHNGKLTVYFN